MYFDTVNVSNISYERTSIKDVKMPLPLFTFMSGHSFTVYNVTAKDVYGPVLAAQEVMNQNFTDCAFENMSSSQNLLENFQNILLTLRNDNPRALGLKPDNPNNIYVDNFNVNVTKNLILN